MALIDRTVYPRFPTTFDADAKELNTLYTPSQDEIVFAGKTVRGDSALLNFLAMLKTFQVLKYFLHPVDIPLAVTRHIHQCLTLAEIPYTAYRLTNFWARSGLNLESAWAVRRAKPPRFSWF